MRKEIIGDATLYLGDCLEVVPSIKIDSLVTDPPYGMGFKSNFRTLKHDIISNDNDTIHLEWTCALEAKHSKYIFCRWDNLKLVPKSKSCITWVKNNWSMGDLEHEHGRQTEIILFYPGDNHFFPIKRPTDVIFSNRTSNELHPTEKPLHLMSQIIKWTDGTVVDPFMGSGTTGVAAINLGRKFIGIEIDPKNFDIACKRIESSTKQSNLFLSKPLIKEQNLLL